MSILYEDGVATPAITLDKGTQIFDRMIIDKYQNSPNFKEYAGAFVSEMDLLFEQIERVYLGRFLKNAVGRQLDIIGIILGQERSVSLPIAFFGMSDNGTPSVPMDKLADEAYPADGGLFKDENQLAYTIVPLSDTIYRRLLTAKAFLSTKSTIDTNITYYALSMLLGSTPRLMTLNTSSTLGANLITNGSFDSDIAGWTDDGGGLGSWDDSTEYGPTLIVQVASDPGTVYQTFTTVIGEEYSVQLSGAKLGGSILGEAELLVNLGTAVGTFDLLTLASAPGNSRVISGVFTATSTSTTIHFGCTDISEDMQVDNVQVAQINPFNLGGKEIRMEVSPIDVTNSEIALIEYFSQYMVPLGTSFNVVKV